jgi:hypothetical protein
MKIYKTLLAALVCGAVASALTASAQQNRQGYITVVRIQGIATYSLGPNEPEHPLVAGKYLSPGSIIYTKADCLVDVVLGKAVAFPQAKWAPDRITAAPDAPVRGFVSYTPSADQNVIRITPDSVLSIDKLTIQDTGADTVSDTELNLKKGKIFASVRKLSGASQYIVKLPTGVAGVRGTLFSIGAEGSVDCFESTGGGVVLALSPANGPTQTFVIPAGQFFNPTLGGNNNGPAPLPPHILNDLRSIFKDIRTVYLAIVAFEYDLTQGHISPTSGNFGGHDSSSPPPPPPEE